MNTIELKLFIYGNDTCFEVDYSPDTGIDEVRVSSYGDPAVIDTMGLYVATGPVFETRMVPLSEELERLASIEFAEHHEEWLDGKRESAMEHRYEMESGK